MGNKCSNQEGSLFNCCGSSKKSHHRAPSGDVLPAELHASSGQKVNAEPSVTATAARPHSLEIHPIPNEENNPKFPAFPLHGIQKSSPSLASGHGTPLGEGTPSAIDVKKIELLFESYCDPSTDEDSILPDGVERFCLDLEVDPTEFIVLALAWKFKAETMCKFTRKEFVEGFLSLQCDSIDTLRSSFKRIESEAMSNFKDLYRYTFQFALDSDQGQRSLPCDIAAAMWNVVFSKNAPTMLHAWIDYLENNSIRGISRDTWNMFLYLTESLQEDFSNYNDTEAWPSIFDDFVDHQREVLEKKSDVEEEAGDDLCNDASKGEKVDETRSSSDTLPTEGDPHQRLSSEAENKAEDAGEGSVNPRLPGAISSSDDSLEHSKQDFQRFSSDAEIGDHIIENEEQDEDFKKEEQSPEAGTDHLHSKTKNLETSE